MVVIFVIFVCLVVNKQMAYWHNGSKIWLVDGLSVQPWNALNLFGCRSIDTHTPVLLTSQQKTSWMRQYNSRKMNLQQTNITAFRPFNLWFTNNFDASYASLNPTFQSHMVCLNSFLFGHLLLNRKTTSIFDWPRSPGCELCHHQRRSHLGVMENAFGHLPPLPIKHPQDFVLTHRRGRLMLYPEIKMLWTYHLGDGLYNPFMDIYYYGDIGDGLLLGWPETWVWVGKNSDGLVQATRLDKSHSSPWRNCLRVSSTQLSQQKVQWGLLSRATNHKERLLLRQIHLWISKARMAICWFMLSDILR